MEKQSNIGLNVVFKTAALTITNIGKNKLIDWLIKIRNRQLRIPVVIGSTSDSELQFRRVLNTLRENKIMVITKENGIYIRLAGDVNKGEHWMDNFVKVADC